MNIDSLTIGEAKQLATLFASTPIPTENHGINIVIADRGFVYVGYVTTDAAWVHISDASNIRVWGTSKGLGELVNGPLPSTKLDKTGNLKLSRKALIALVSVSEESWKRKL